MKPDEYDVIDEGIKRVNAILSRIPKIENRLDDINRQLSPSGNNQLSVNQWCSLVNERSNLRLELKKLEAELKEKYHLAIQESEKIEINPFDTTILLKIK